ncbi:GNAT family N-acetyltransferase [Paenibacillus sp. D2_2]|uniref:GNAT family N-acetyltransferase n=1 Tax=Paenibacillus sp. D2_2 TaxID=3073092 RepID=UPI0028153CC2|nr:GNAT family N-acetyltransferase [Paenibacillus sp. D2_2]WMT42758.1 GNAT family N-acetyltransferase [Paenibacillus sp. D2_2]
MSSQVYAPALIIRKGCSDDVHHLLPLMRQLRYPTTHSVLKERLRMLEDNQLHHSLVAEVDGVVRGTIFLKQYQTHDMNQPITQIIAMIVDEDHRSSGIGKRLMSEAESWCKDRGSSQLFLSVTNENSLIAKSFYESMGFTCTGHRRFSKTLS